MNGIYTCLLPSINTFIKFESPPKFLPITVTIPPSAGKMSGSTEWISGSLNVKFKGHNCTSGSILVDDSPVLMAG